MIEKYKRAEVLESGKSRVPFVAGVALLVIGFVFCRTLSVAGSETASTHALVLAQVHSKPVRTAATQDAVRVKHDGQEASAIDSHSGQMHGLPPSVILQPHPQIRKMPVTQQQQQQQQQQRLIQKFPQHTHNAAAQPVQTHALPHLHQQMVVSPHGLVQPQTNVPNPNAGARPVQPVKPPEKEKGSFIPLVDESGAAVAPSAVVSQNGKFFFLGPKHLWSLEWTQPAAGQPRKAFLKACHPPDKIEKIPVQEFNNMISVPPRKSLVILSKAGDLFEYFTETGAWHQYRANLWLTGSPDPDYVDLAFNGKDIILIDPERNNIHVCPPNSRYLTPYFREVMPWQVRRGDYYLGDGIGIAYDGLTYLLRKQGGVTRFSGNSRANVRQLKFAYHAPGKARLRPSRIITAANSPLFIVERENNRVLSIDKKSGQTAHFVFPSGSDLRGLAPIKDGFVVVNGNRLVTRRLDSADPANAEIHPRSFDQRLDGIGIPVPGGCLPSHLGVFPGARRLYRYGIHAGVDFFNGAGNKVVMGTPALAADRGKIIRIDQNFKDMDAPTFNRVMSQCARDHTTSDHNEDLFRGCQVWIDHGNRMVTRYAHLDRINAKLKKDTFVNRGDIVGFIGVSGTGQNLPGKAKYPHLHFEIWLDGHYVGYGLTPGETLGVYEDIFGR
ncbi:MAG: M23 family metallopeptidase [Candidatus Obscuribacterales bacterium]|nr:M23 family metallopeptidase [Candidatus Obscuribacterales bacterium]